MKFVPFPRIGATDQVFVNPSAVAFIIGTVPGQCRIWFTGPHEGLPNIEIKGDAADVANQLAAAV